MKPCCAPLLLLASCASSSIYGGTTATARRSTTASGSDSAAAGSTSGTATGTSSGGTGSTGGSSTSGTTGQFNCPSTLSDCPAGQVEYTSQVWDPVLKMPVSRPVQLTDLNDAQLSATSDANSIVSLCVPSGLVLAPELIAAGYTPTIYNDLLLYSSECTRQIPLDNSQFWQQVVGILPSDYDTSQATIVVTVNSIGSCSLEGWTLSVAGADGGMLDAGLVYIAGFSVSDGATSTSTDGEAIFYNLDPSAGDVSVIGVQVTDAGQPCVQDVNANEHTGQIHVAGNGVISSFALVVVDAG